MAHAPEKRAIVRASYVHERQPLEVAADRADVSLRTAARWKRDAGDEGDDWDRARAAKHLAGEGMQGVATAALEDFVMLLKSTMASIRDSEDVAPLIKAEALSRLADAYAKMISAFGKTMPQLSRLAIATEVLREMGDYVREHKPELADVFVSILDPVAERLAVKFA